MHFFDTLFPYLPETNTSKVIPLPTIPSDSPDSSCLDPYLDKPSSSLSNAPPPVISPVTSPQSNTSYSFHSPSSSDLDSIPTTHIPLPISRKEPRQINKHVWLKDFVLNCATDRLPIPTALHISKVSSSEPYPILTYRYANSTSFDHACIAFLGNVSNVKEPTTYVEASTKVEWIEAMNKELLALKQNNTWEITDLPIGKRAIRSKCVYKIKLNPDGTVERYKARLVAKGYNKDYGIDYTESFSPVVKLVAVRVILAVATARGWSLFQLDINNAFLHGYLDEEVYMTPPQRYSKAAHGQVCKLKRSLYGLKQASRQWNTEFSAKLIHFGFQQSVFDHCMSTMTRDTSHTLLLVYVDDIIITGSDIALLKQLKQYLDDTFTIKDLGYAKYFLGVEIARNDQGTYLCQRKYVLHLLHDSGLEGCQPTPIYLPQGIHLSSQDGTPLPDPNRYRNLIGRLLYLNLTRLDITYYVQQLSQFVTQPYSAHWDAAIHVLRYLKGCPSLGLFYPSQNDLILRAYSDNDWASCKDTRKSITGYCVFLGPALISWKSKKQTTISKSSAEAEYRTLSTTVCELQWISYIGAEFKLQIPTPIPLWCDNQAAMHIVANSIFHERTKHLEIDCHVVRNKFKEGFITLHHVSSKLQLADLFTKVLGNAQFQFLLSKLGLLGFLHLLLLENSPTDVGN